MTALEAENADLHDAVDALRTELAALRLVVEQVVTGQTARRG